MSEGKPRWGHCVT